MAGLANEKERALSTFARAAGHGLAPTDRNAGHRKWQCVAAVPTRAIRLTIAWQCDMVVNPVGRHTGRSAFRHGAGQAETLPII